jgi:hypothetical protein
LSQADKIKLATEISFNQIYQGFLDNVENPDKNNSNNNNSGSSLFPSLPGTNTSSDTSDLFGQMTSTGGSSSQLSQLGYDASGLDPIALLQSALATNVTGIKAGDLVQIIDDQGRTISGTLLKSV